MMTDARYALKDRVFKKCISRTLEEKHCRDCIANETRMCTDSRAFELLPLKKLEEDVIAFENDDEKHIFARYTSKAKYKGPKIPHKIAIKAKNRYTGTITEYESVAEAADALELSCTTVSRGKSRNYIFEKI